MASITLGGAPCNTVGDLPAVGSKAPAFTLTTKGLEPASLSDFSGKKVVLSIIPSVNTGVCSASMRKFNEAFASRDDGVVLSISADLPFALDAFCATEGIENVVPLSVFRSPGFGNDYGVRIADGGFEGLMARAVVVLDENGTVKYTELVPEIGQEPNYDAALAAL